jgi:SagB-type dehydrogenase family enzyme
LISLFLTFNGLLVGSTCFADDNLPEVNTIGSYLLEDALLSSSWVEFENIQSCSLPLTSLSQMLWSAQGITDAPFRAAPSAGGTYPLELFTVTTSDGVEDLEEGLYQYKPVKHSLEKKSPIVSILDFHSFLSDDDQAFLNQSETIILITAEFEKTTNRYGNRGIQYVWIEVGHVLQNLLLQAESLQLKLHPFLSFNQTGIQELIGTSYVPLCGITIHKERVIGSSKSAPSYGFQLLENKVGISVEEAIFRRRSIREYEIDQELSLSSFSKLFGYCYGATHPITGKRLHSPLNDTYPIRLTVLCSQVEKTSPGVYRYIPETNNFTTISLTDKREELWGACLNQNWVLGAQINIVYMAPMNDPFIPSSSSIEWKHLVWLETGRIAQNFYLESVALGLGTVVIGAFHDIEVNEIARFNSSEIAWYVQPIGVIKSPLWDFSVLSLSSISPQWRMTITLSSLIWFFLAIFFVTPRVKRKVRKYRFWHHFFAVLFCLSSFLHFWWTHAWSNLIGLGIIDGTKRILQSVTPSIPLSMTSTAWGLFLGKIGLWFSLFFIILRFIPVNRVITPRRKRWIHRVSGFVGLVILLLHGVINGVWIPKNYIVFTIILLSCVVFLLISYSSKVVQIVSTLKRSQEKSSLKKES